MNSCLQPFGFELPRARQETSRRFEQQRVAIAKTLIAPLPRRAVVAVRCVEHFEGELTHQQGWIWSVRLCAQVVTFDLFDY